LFKIYHTDKFLFKILIFLCLKRKLTLRPRLHMQVWQSGIVRKACINVFSFCHSGIAGILCARGQEILLHTLSNKNSEFEVKNRRKSVEEAKAQHYCCLLQSWSLGQNLRYRDETRHDFTRPRPDRDF